MKLLRRLAGSLNALLRRNEVEEELDEELRQFLEHAVERNLSKGMPLDEATRAARIEVGTFDAVKERVRDVGWESYIETIWQDVRYAARRLAGSPGFTAVATITLGLGIGGNLAIFNLYYEVLVKPLPYQSPDELVSLWGDRGGTRSETAPPDFRDWQQQTRTLSGLAAYSYGSTLAIQTEDGPSLIATLGVTSNFFQVLGVHPVQGRAFRDEEDDTGAPRVAIASHGLWQRQFGGKALTDGAKVQGYEIVGVMPAGFQFAERKTDLWIPVIMSELGDRRGNNILLTAGRLKPGSTLESAQAEMNTIAANQAAAYPATNANRGIRVFPLRDEFAGSVRTIYSVFFVAAAAVLLVACLSVAHLLLLRGLRRHRELAVRSSLGATRARLVQQLLIESLLLAVLGSAAAMAVSNWTFGLFTAFVPESMVGLTELRINGPVIFFAVATALAAALAAGLIPALRLSGLRLFSAMQDGGRSGTARNTTRLRDAIVVCEIAVSVVLLVCSSVFIGTILRLQALNPGFDMKNLLTVQVASRRADEYAALLERVRALPGVTAAGMSTLRPLQGIGGRRSLIIDGYAYRDASDQPRALFRTISTDYLEALKVPLLQGRTFDAGDVTGAQPVAIINESLRRRYWGERDAIGQRLQIYQEGRTNPWLTVVGVVGDVRQRGLDIDPEPELMIPYLQLEGAAFYRPRNLVARTAGDPALLQDAVRNAVTSIDPAFPAEVRTMEDAAVDGLSNRRPRILLITGYAAMTLLLSILGIYSLVSFAVADRTQEIGVRLALGASLTSVMRIFVKQGIALSAIGCTLGLVIATALTDTLTSFLYGVMPEPAFLVSVSLLILIVAIAASVVPARRARKIDPVIALRCE